MLEVWRSDLADKECATCERLFEELQWAEELPDSIDCPDCGHVTDLKVATFDPSDPNFEEMVVDYLLEQSGEGVTEEDIREYKRVARNMSEIDDNSRVGSGLM